MLTKFWEEIIDEQLPSNDYDEGLAEEIARSGGFTVRQIEEYIKTRPPLVKGFF